MRTFSHETVTENANIRHNICYSTSGSALWPCFYFFLFVIIIWSPSMTTQLAITNTCQIHSMVLSCWKTRALVSADLKCNLLATVESQSHCLPNSWQNQSFITHHNSIVNKEKIMQRHWLHTILCVPFSAFMLLVIGQLCHVWSKVLFWNKKERKWRGTG